MKIYIFYFIMLLALLNCKQKPETVEEVPEHLRTDQNSNFEKEKDNAKINEEIEAVERTEKIEKEEIEEVSEELDDGEKVYDNEILKGIEEIDPWDYRHLPIKTQNDVDAIMAFQIHTSNPETRSYLSKFQFQDIDGDFTDEVLMEYTVMSSDSGANWAGFSFLVFKVENKDYIPIIDANVGSKYVRYLSFQKLLYNNQFVFKIEGLWDTTWGDPDTKLGDEVIFIYEEGKFTEVKD
ncbi:hypothetical protein MWU78_18405 [Arenibacter sp. F26102]|uniref:hypothetical protein n=1 Tax=Arenibacter sp. F26102 TaxID=2926416 RepID=UPI001FF3CA30|nr:hypothetical protein [Arenibacter sp. F26102]MCK0147633.1 hypothetical protein [Arenibacter sp. F26102]